MDGAVSIGDVISREIVRKLRLATEAETNEDREIVCEEVFVDITGQVDAEAKERLHIHGSACFYEVLSQYYMRDLAAADTVLYICKRLWGQPYVAPIFALLLHRFLLLRPEAGGMEQRQKHVNVLMLGSRQLFLGDVQSGMRRFGPLFAFMAHNIVLSPIRTPLDSLPADARANVLAVVAAYLPYYEDRMAVRSMLDDFPSSSHTLTDGGHTPGEGADFVVTKVTETITKVRTEEGLLAYLEALQALGGADVMRNLGVITRLRLQNELYSLTTPGGPHYAPQSVRKAASRALDALFPLGKRSRKVVRWLFQYLQPANWLGSTVVLGAARLWTSLYAHFVGNVLMSIWRVLAWGRQQQPQEHEQQQQQQQHQAHALEQAMHH